MTKFTLIIMKEVTVLHAHMTENSVGVCWEVLGHRWWCWWVPEGRSQALVRPSWFTVCSVNLWDETRCCWGRRWCVVAVGWVVAWRKQHFTLLAGPRLSCGRLLLLLTVFLLLLSGGHCHCRCPCCCEGSIGDSMLFLL